MCVAGSYSGAESLLVSTCWHRADALVASFHSLIGAVSNSSEEGRIFSYSLFFFHKVNYGQSCICPAHSAHTFYLF